jgi:molybdopterin-guanine dinucleotide biosynthesis protein A
MRSLNGLVLAGGRSSRMEREKAFLRVGGPSGRTLISRQLDLLADFGVERRIVSVRRDMRWTAPGVTVGHDEVEGRGPLGGIAEAMRLDPAKPLLVLAVDMPEVDERILERLIEGSAPDGGAAPRIEGRWEPLCAVYPPRALETIERMAQERRWSPSELLDRLSREGRIRPLHLTEEAGRRLRSWNRPGDVPGPVRAANRWEVPERDPHGRPQKLQPIAV